MFTMDSQDGSRPKRGDLLQTNVGSRRERTWLILHVRKVESATHPQRYRVFAARWWELEPETRQRLYRSAVRAGGQQEICYKPYPAKRRLRFEDFMQRTAGDMLQAIPSKAPAEVRRLHAAGDPRSMIESLWFVWKSWTAYRKAKQSSRPQYFALTIHGVPQVCVMVATGREAWRITQRAIEEFKP